MRKRQSPTQYNFVMIEGMGRSNRKKISPNLYPIRRPSVQDARCDLSAIDSGAFCDQIRLNCNDPCG